MAPKSNFRVGKNEVSSQNKAACVKKNENFSIWKARKLSSELQAANTLTSLLFSAALWYKQSWSTTCNPTRDRLNYDVISHYNLFFLLNFVNLRHYLEHFWVSSLSAYNIAEMFTKNPFMIRNEQLKKIDHPHGRVESRARRRKNYNNISNDFIVKTLRSVRDQ